MSPVVTLRPTRRTRRPSPSLVIAALRAGEVWPVVTVHEGLSPASRRLRYSAPTPRLSPRMLRTLTNLHPGHHEAYAGWREGRPVGIVRWIRTPDLPDTAELALEVVDAEQGREVGRALSAYAASRARREGIRTMLVSVDPDNDRVHHWLRALGARATVNDADRYACRPRRSAGLRWRLSPDGGDGDGIAVTLWFHVTGDGACPRAARRRPRRR